MNYIGKFISNFRDFYNEINAATLTGAIDVVVVEQPDGTFTSSPFHVRFGKLGVLRSREKVVDIEINGEPLDIHMKLGESGEAFFVEEVTDDEDDFPSYLACSPIPLDKPIFLHQTPSDETFDDKFNTSALSNVSVGEFSLGDQDNVEAEAQSPSQCGTDIQVLDLSRTSNTSIEASLGNRLDRIPTNCDDSVIQFEQIQPQNAPKTFKAETVVNSRNVADFRPIHVEASVGVQTDQMLEIGHLLADVGISFGEGLKQDNKGSTNDEGKSVKRKRRKRSLMKRKGSKKSGLNGTEEESKEPAAVDPSDDIFEMEDVDSLESSLSRHSLTASTDSNLCMYHVGGIMIGSTTHLAYNPDCELCTDRCKDLECAVNTGDAVAKILSISDSELASVDHELSRLNSSGAADFHFFSDTEATSDRSPLGSRPSSPVQSDTEFEIKRQSIAIQTEDEKEQQSWKWGELPTPPPRMGFSRREESAQDVEPVSSDDETSKKEQEAEAQRSMLSGMFSFMKKTKRIRHNPESEGVYLDDLNVEDLDPEVAALYFPATYRNGGQTSVSHVSEISANDEDAESGNGPSLPQSPHSVEGAICGPKSLDSDFEDSKHSVFEQNRSYGGISLSLCGGLADCSDLADDTFLQSMVTYNDIVENPKLFENPNLVVRFNGKYYNWQTACPIIMTLILFQKPLPEKVISILEHEYMPHKKDNRDKKRAETKGYSSWFSWRRSEPKKDPSPEVENKTMEDYLPEQEEREAIQVELKECAKEEQVEILQEVRPRKSIAIDISPCLDDQGESKEHSGEDAQASFPGTPEMTDVQKESKEEGYSGSNSSDESDGGLSNVHCIKVPMDRRKFFGGSTEIFRKTLRLSSEQINKLNLKEGANEVMFSVTTAYQGTTRCKCHIYRWRYDDKIVISDIDGTITKSDVLGHILPIVGKDWAQSGVAQLFTKIRNNGYKLLYLSARAIGQARVTREYLKSIKQGDLSLPEGPLLLNPTSLISAFHREVIEKKPEEFKISCLRDIQALFPPNTKPFYAGYGNKINDVWAYRAVGIPIFRIFTINHRGELKHELTQTFQSSYSNMSYIVDQMFPPLPEDTSDYSNFVYWRDPIPEITIEIEEPTADTSKEKK